MFRHIFKTTMFFMICAISSIAALPTREEIVAELASIRSSNPQFNDGIDPTAAYYLERINETRVLDATTTKWEYIKKYITMCVSAMVARSKMGNMILLSKDNAPKTYEFIEAVAQKMDLHEMPLVYFMFDEHFFNAFAVGVLQSLSIVSLGEKMIKESKDLETLEFLIAHELAHIKNYDPLKMGIITAIATSAFDGIFTHYQIPQAAGFYSMYDSQGNIAFAYNSELIKPYINFAVKSLLIIAITSWYSRKQERNADITAANVVGARGGVALFNLVKEKNEHSEIDYSILQAELAKTSLKDSRWFQLRIATFKVLDTILKLLGKPFDTHPQNDVRIAYLEELQKEQEKQALFVQ